MNGKRFGIGFIVCVVAGAIVLTGGIAATVARAPWQDGLAARSDALNRQHHLGAYAPRSLGSPGPGWLKALAARSEALNRAYGLGTGARRSPSATEEGWRRALAIRSDALNRKYGVGEYASQQP